MEHKNMKINYENTRRLGIGETVTSADFCCIPATEPGEEPELHYVDKPEVGKIITDEELIEYRRSLQADPIATICQQYGIETKMGLEALKVAIANVATLDMKQRDYGSGNISSFGEFGVLVRMNDKMERLKNLWKMQEPKNESVEDSYLDLSNYALIAILVRRGIWK
jgi:hypothetical protein